MRHLKVPDQNYLFFVIEIKRLWIGSFEGTIMTGKNNKAETFKQSEMPLKETTITEREDENSNIYFAVYDYISRRPKRQAEEGMEMKLYYFCIGIGTC